MERSIFDEVLKLPAIECGIKEGGVYIQVGLGAGFYIPRADYELALGRAKETGKVQFVGLAHDGSAIHGEREDLLYDARLAGFIAWIWPKGSEVPDALGS